MKIKIKNHNGDILGNNSEKNIINYNQNSTEVISEIGKLLILIKDSDISNKEILIENIEKKINKPKELKDYLGTIADMSTIPANIVSIIQSIPL